MQAPTVHIIRRSSHSVSRKLISPNALRILYRLRDNGFVARLVGGAVRDILLGRTPKDFDIVTDATPAQIKHLFRNCRLVGRRFRLAHIHFRDEIIEVATFRASFVADTEEPDAAETEDEQSDRDDRHQHRQVNEDGLVLRDNLFGTPEEDAWRRDFGINALAYDITDFSVVDYVGGMQDLEQRSIRTIGDPWARFTEDPVRMLRAVRLASQLGFTIEKTTWEALRDMAGRIALASPARLFDELLKLFFSGAATDCYDLLCQGGLDRALLPEFDDWLQQGTGNSLARTLQWLDRRREGGLATSPHLLLAALFSGYLDWLAAAADKGDAPYQVRLDRALATFAQELSGRILIPQRTLMKMREVLLLGSRLVQVPGRRPQSVIARPGFADAVVYLHLRGEDDHDLAKSAHWWERYATDQVLPPAAAVETAAGDTRRRRPRRRRRKRHHAT